MRHYFAILPVLLINASSYSYGMSTSNSDAFAVMKAIDQRYKGDSWTMISNVVLIDKDKNKSQRRIKSLNKVAGKDQKGLTVLLEPARIKGTSFLTYTWKGAERENEAWLYLPDLGKTMRLATANRADYFLGSDFSYSDLEGLKLDDFEYAFAADETAPAGQVVIDAEPRKDNRDKIIEKTGYQKIRYWVDKDKSLPIKVKYWLKDNGWIKYYSASNVEKINGAWVIKREQMVMTRQDAMEHATVIEVDSVDINGAIDDGTFGVSNLERAR